MGHLYHGELWVITRWYGIRSNPSGDPRGDLEMLKSEDVQHSNEGWGCWASQKTTTGTPHHHHHRHEWSMNGPWIDNPLLDAQLQDVAGFLMPIQAYKDLGEGPARLEDKDSLMRKTMWFWATGVGALPGPMASGIWWALHPSYGP